jgi:phospholipid/cholesterol/gamma-HCH transport system ATP-binding protein
MTDAPPQQARAGAGQPSAKAGGAAPASRQEPAPAPAAGTPLIEVKGLCKSFGMLDVLRGADLSIAKGESMVVIGGSGTGKSVLIKHIIGLLRPNAGTVTVDGRVVADLKRPELGALRRRMGMLFQYAALFDSMNVADNVAFAMRQHTRMSEKEIADRVDEVLSMVGLTGAQETWPAELSGGMKKRAGLARAIALGPEIILYDEPTTGLDPILADQINDLVLDLKERLNVTSVAITHDMISAYKIADRIAMLYEGRIEEVGTPEEIQNSSNPVIQQFIHGRAEGPITTR